MQVASSMSMSVSYTSVSFSASKVSAQQAAAKPEASAETTAKPVAKPQPDVSIEVGKHDRSERGDQGDRHENRHENRHDNGRRGRGYGGGMAGRLIRKMDDNRDGGVSLAELQDSRLGKRISEEKFNQVDKNGDGQMTARELRSHFRQSLFGNNEAQKPTEADAAKPAAETGSASNVAQIASAQALASVTSVSVSVSVASASYQSATGAVSGNPVGDAEVPQQPVTAEAPTELTVPEDKKPTAAMEELAKIEAEAAADAAGEVEGEGDLIDELGDLFQMIADGALEDLDPMKLIEELAELMDFDFGGDDDDDMSIGSLGGSVDAGFAAAEISLEAFSFEASMTTATMADGSTATSMSVNFSAISAYSRTMEFSAAA